MKEALRRRIVDLAVLLLFVAGITLLSAVILAVLWMALIWVGHFAAMVLPAWLVTTARYAVWAFALMGVATGAILAFFVFHQDALLWAHTAVGIENSEKAPGELPTPSA